MTVLYTLPAVHRQLGGRPAVQNTISVVFSIVYCSPLLLLVKKEKRILKSACY